MLRSQNYLPLSASPSSFHLAIFEPGKWTTTPTKHTNLVLVHSNCWAHLNLVSLILSLSSILIPEPTASSKPPLPQFHESHCPTVSPATSPTPRNSCCQSMALPQNSQHWTLLHCKSNILNTTATWVLLVYPKTAAAAHYTVPLSVPHACL